MPPRDTSALKDRWMACEEGRSGWLLNRQGGDAEKMKKIELPEISAPAVFSLAPALAPTVFRWRQRWR